MRFADEADGQALRGALFLVDGRLEPVDFSFARVAVEASFLWRAGGARRRATADLCCSLFKAAAHVPELIVALGDELPPGVVGDDLEVAVPVCRIARSETSMFAPYETSEQLSDRVDVYWIGDPPRPDTSARLLVNQLIAQGGLTEPFDRALAGLIEAFEHS